MATSSHSSHHGHSQLRGGPGLLLDMAAVEVVLPRLLVFAGPLKTQRTRAAQIIKGITRNNFVEFILRQYIREGLRNETNLVSLPLPVRKLSKGS